jgi:hypothetical protein
VEEKGKTAARFDPLRDKYRVLERFEVQVPDAQLELLDRLDAEWARFQVSWLGGWIAAWLPGCSLMRSAWLHCCPVCLVVGCSVLLCC